MENRFIEIPIVTIGFQFPSHKFKHTSSYWSLHKSSRQNNCAAVDLKAAVKDFPMCERIDVL